MGRKKKPEEHENHERYLVSYADLMTLLLALFIILFAMSEVNEDRFQEVARSFEMALHSGSPSVININDAGMHARQTLTQDEVTMMNAVSENNVLRKMQRSIDQAAKENGLEDHVQSNLDELGLKIVLTNEVLFDSGSAELRMENVELIEIIGTMLVDIDNQVQVNGFTDNVPISTLHFASNWELSSARALSVLLHIIETNSELHPERFSHTGYGEYHPIANNNTLEGRQENRRVEILIKRENIEGLLRAD